MGEAGREMKGMGDHGKNEMGKWGRCWSASSVRGDFLIPSRARIKPINNVQT